MLGAELAMHTVYERLLHLTTIYMYLLLRLVGKVRLARWQLQ